MGDLIKFDDMADDITGIEDASDGHADRLRVTFANGYTLSVIRGAYTYGGRDGLFEVGVMVNGTLTYGTPVTDSVIGYLTPEEVRDVARQVRDLPHVRKSIDSM